MAHHGLAFAEKHDFWTNYAVEVGDFAPAFKVDELHGCLIDFVLETVFDHVVTGILVHLFLEFFLVNILHLFHDVLFKAHVRPIGKQIFDISIVACQLLGVQVQAPHHLCRVIWI